MQAVFSLSMTSLSLSSDGQLVLFLGGWRVICEGRWKTHAHCSSGLAVWHWHCLFRGKCKQIDWEGLLQLFMLTHLLHYQWGKDAGQGVRGMPMKWFCLSLSLPHLLSVQTVQGYPSERKRRKHGNDMGEVGERRWYPTWSYFMKLL